MACGRSGTAFIGGRIGSLCCLARDSVSYAKSGVPADDLGARRQAMLHFSHNLNSGGAQEMLDVAFSFPIKLIANALGTPPQIMLDRARDADVPVAALVGSKKHQCGKANPLKEKQLF